MHVPAWPVYPDQTAAASPSQLFRVPALAGLGVVCDPDTGACYEDGEDIAGSGEYLGIDPSAYEPPANATNLSFPQFTGGQIPQTPPGTKVNVLANGQTITYQNQGSQAAPNYVPVLMAATAGAIDLAKLIAIQPGTLQQGNTTTRQNPGFPVSAPVTSTGLGLGVNANTGGSLIIAAAVGLGIIALLMGGKKS